MTETPTAHDIATDLAEYLRENPGVCAHLNVPTGYLRYADGEWQVARYADCNPNDRVEARVVDEDTAVSLLTSKPSTLEPVATAGAFSRSIWEDAEDQDAFAGVERCAWCGTSERDAVLRRYESVEDGEVLLCPDCHREWDDAGEIEHEIPEGEPA